MIQDSVSQFVHSLPKFESCPASTHSYNDHITSDVFHLKVVFGCVLHHNVRGDDMPITDRLAVVSQQSIHGGQIFHQLGLFHIPPLSKLTTEGVQGKFGQ